MNFNVITDYIPIREMCKKPGSYQAEILHTDVFTLGKKSGIKDILKKLLMTQQPSKI